MLSIDFWGIRQWRDTTKAASSPADNVACVCRPKQSTGIWDLFHWRFCILKSKLIKISCGILIVLFVKARKSLFFICYDSRFVLIWTKSCFYHLKKILDRWLWLHRIWLQCIMTRAHVWTKIVYGNHIMTLRWQEPIEKYSVLHMNSISLAQSSHHSRHWDGKKTFISILYPIHNIKKSLYFSWHSSRMACRNVLWSTLFVTLLVLWTPGKPNNTRGIQASSDVLQRFRKTLVFHYVPCLVPHTHQVSPNQYLLWLLK